MPLRCIPSACLLVLCARLAFAEAMDYPPTLGTLPMNQVQIIGTHNSYHVQPSATLDPLLVTFLNSFPASLQELCPGAPDSDSCVQRLRYTHATLEDQLNGLDIRTFELDVFADPDGGIYQSPLGWRLANGSPPPPFDPALLEPGFKVLHIQDIDFRSRCLTLTECLTTLRDWSLANPDHLPILVMIEVKDELLMDVPVLPPFADPPPFTPEMFDALDAAILDVFDVDHLLLPDDVRGTRPTLREAVLMDGWPTLDEARGLVYFALNNGGSHLSDYVMGHPSLAGRVMFTNSASDSDEAAFIIRDDPSAADIPSLVEQGFLVRTRADSGTLEAVANDTTRRDRAFASGAHFVSTDYPVPDPMLSTYSVEFEDHPAFRCNPINSPSACSFVPEPSLALLQVVALGTVIGLRVRGRPSHEASTNGSRAQLPLLVMLRRRVRHEPAMGENTI